MSKICSYSPLPSVLEKVVDNRGKTVPTSSTGLPLIATNCIKHTSIYPTLENVRYVDEKTLKSWFRSHLEPNDILFVNKGTPGRSCLVPDPVPFCIAQDMIGLRCDKKNISHKYLFAVLRSDYIQKKIENYHVGLVIPHFKKQDLLNIRIPRKESVIEEEKIGELYIALSMKIELNNRINAVLESMAKTLYDYWFVQFDYPDQNGKPYKSSGGKMVYNTTLKREIPDGWNDKQLCQIANITMGQSPSGDSYNESGDGEVFFQGSTDFGLLFPSIRQYTTKPARMAKRGDILLSVRAPVGDMNIANVDCCIGRGLAALNSKEDFNGFLFYVMKYFKRIFERRNSEGTTFGSITKDDLYSLNLAYPKVELLKEYEKVVSNNNKMIYIRSMENQQLIALRDWLLPMLMNGQVTVK